MSRAVGVPVGVEKLVSCDVFNAPQSLISPDFNEDVIDITFDKSLYSYKDSYLRTMNMYDFVCYLSFTTGCLLRKDSTIGLWVTTEERGVQREVQEVVETYFYLVTPES